MDNHTYVAIDLEMTGLQTGEDEIIEIGAVKFQGETVLETFSHLVKPHQPLPLRISRMTGITTADLQTAPRFNDIAPDLVRFLGTHPLVGHSAERDIEMLQAQGVQVGQPIYDTFHLSTMLLPQLPAYKLASLAGHLGIVHPEAHRALHDADVTRQVFCRLLKRIAALELRDLDEISGLIGKTNWDLSDLFLSIHRDRARHAFAADTPARPVPAQTLSRGPLWKDYRSENEKPLKPTGDTTLLDLETVAGFFAPGGPMNHVFAAYEQREAQVQMARSVAQAFNAEDSLIVEAGTGTGKSMAYLVPSALFGKQRGERVVVSTNTINLQDQLFLKDIPDLQRMMAQDTSEEPFTAALLKGRSNYLCLRRYKTLLKDDTVQPEEARVLLKTRFWLKKTLSGDGNELILMDRERLAWSKINVPADTCTGPRCPDFQDCFFFKARRHAETAHIVVVNHALLLSDLVSESRVLPLYDHIVIDEAHNLEQVATDQFSFTIDQAALFLFLDSLFQEGGVKVVSGLLSEVPVHFRDSTATPADLEKFTQISADMRPSIARAREAGQNFFACLTTFTHQEQDENQNNQQSEQLYDIRIRLTPGVRKKTEWGTIEQAWDAVHVPLMHIGETLGRLETLLVDLEHANLYNYDELMMRVQSLKRYATDVRVQTNQIIRGDENAICWLTLNMVSQTITLTSAPLKVSDLLQTNLFSQKQTCILTSATLSINATLDFIKDRMGLLEPEELLLESPFDYEQQTVIYIPNDIPEPNQRGYQQKVEEALIQLCTATGGAHTGAFYGKQRHPKDS